MLRFLVKSSLAALACLAVAVTAQAAQFDYLLLAASWQPGFCANHGTKPECQNLAGTYAANNLALHGLWPNNYDGSYPSYCGAPSRDVSLDKKSQWCSMDRYGVSSSVLSNLSNVMPGVVSCLDKHEWWKHGDCSGQSANTYWDNAAGLMQRFGQTGFNTFLQQNAGGYVALADLQNAFEGTFGSGSSSAISFNCTDIGSDSYLTEVWIPLNPAALAAFPDPSALVGDATGNSTCPSDSIYIATP